MVGHQFFDCIMMLVGYLFSVYNLLFADFLIKEYLCIISSSHSFYMCLSRKILLTKWLNIKYFVFMHIHICILKIVFLNEIFRVFDDDIYK